MLRSLDKKVQNIIQSAKKQHIRKLKTICLRFGFVYTRRYVLRPAAQWLPIYFYLINEKITFIAFTHKNVSNISFACLGKCRVRATEVQGCHLHFSHKFQTPLHNNCLYSQAVILLLKNRKQTNLRQLDKTNYVCVCVLVREEQTFFFFC